MAKLGADVLQILAERADVLNADLVTNTVKLYQHNHFDQDNRFDLLATAVCSELCNDLINHSVEDLNFYALKRPELTRDVCYAIRYIAHHKRIKGYGHTRLSPCQRLL